MFRDREDAARQLAEQLKKIELRDPVVLGVPRGGVVTAAVLARELDAECDVVLVRKLRAPAQPELAIGALAEDGEVFLSNQGRELIDPADEYFEQERRERLEELAERRELFRAVRPAAQLKGRSVIVTDDGIATGSTMFAAVQAIKGREPHELILAVPVAPPGRLDQFETDCDRVICLDTPEGFMAIGQFYENFEQVSDAQARDLLAEAYRS